ncbi:MAG: hypothetical protein ACI35T_04530 [Alistipes sp.]
MESNELEFKEMKNQFRLLRERLDKQVEINEKQLRRAIGEGLGNIRRRDRVGLFLCVALTVLLPLSLIAQGYNWLFVGATFVLLAVNAIKAYLIKIDASRNIDRLDLVSTSKRLLKYKHDNSVYIVYSMPVLMVWVLWYLYEIGVKLQIGSVTGYLLMFSCMLSGGVLGGIIGYFSFYRPSMRDADRVLGQIEEITGEE